MRSLLALIIGMTVVISSHAKDTTAIKKALNMLRRVQAKSLQQPVSFDLKYTYSNEHTPYKLLDSLQGKVEMNGENYRCLLDHTETIHNGIYNIVLFKEDKLMYLAKNSKAASPVDPLATIYSLLEAATGSSFSYQQKNTIIDVTFPANGPCKKMSIVIDTVSQRVISMNYVLKTTMLISADNQGDELPVGYEEYALVKTNLYNYKEIAANKSRYDEKEFFYREGDVLKVTPAYQDYNIFVGSPDL
ncbi:hypothetical protein [Chitinophaga sancti]|uniref:Outer membrane lipoprotein-sorting protein n=1 Tax=Chitinophaga sancti TaxID=1004 RepID=A0A1K1SC49_9BACT|nr:hypothetical protein [Chitinophaga sancti]WQD63583.1 hypothetical protein U0033_04185 [Chitinophaga sancti]WQG90791.1 hypothetical protein SR876_04730 [Chitinophaga sancti]SFW81862.1 hypothetical protein SAMN05661012_05154 [Chitinophaga sancti]